MDSQTCTKCAVEKSIDRYVACKGYRTGYTRICRDCMNEATNARRLANPEYARQMGNINAKKSYARNRETILEKLKARDQDVVNAKRRARRVANPEKTKQTRKKENAKYAEQNKLRSQRYRENNKERIREKHNQYCRTYYAKPERRLSHSVTVLMNRMLRRGKEGKSWKTYVDYTLDQLVAHLESQFQEGMSWDNYGSWHVDHIIPRVLLPCVDASEENFKTCWALPNLRPLWAKDNLSKGSRILDL